MVAFRSSFLTNMCSFKKIKWLSTSGIHQQELENQCFSLNLDFLDPKTYLKLRKEGVIPLNQIPKVIGFFCQLPRWRWQTREPLQDLWGRWHCPDVLMASVQRKECLRSESQWWVSEIYILPYFKHNPHYSGTSYIKMMNHFRGGGT